VRSSNERACFAEQAEAVAGQDRLPAALAHEQRFAELLLEGRDVGRDGRLRNAEALRGAGEVAVLGGGQEDLELAQGARDHCDGARARVGGRNGRARGTGPRSCSAQILDARHRPSPGIKNLDTVKMPRIWRRSEHPANQKSAGMKEKAYRGWAMAMVAFASFALTFGP